MLGELVASASPILPTFFGGEEGIATNRTTLPAFFGLRFGSQLETYYLIAAWCFVCAALMFSFTRTPLGRMSMAVRINPERTEFNGYSAATVRFLVFCLSSFFAGIAGSLAAINFELMTVANISARQSGTVLLMTFVGGVEHFIGPILGAILVVFLQIFLSDLTDAWMLYFGLLFVVVVVFAPGGLAGLIMLHAPLVHRWRLHKILPYYAVMLLPMSLGLVGAVGLIGMARNQWASNSSSTMHFLGTEYSAGNPIAWGAALLLMFAGLWLGRLWASRVSKAFVLLAHEPPKQVGR
jgi:branched-chain amino acid transport system permease protein